MLPFTKRPGRDDEHTQDDAPTRSGGAKARQAELPRAFMPSISDEETSLIPAKALGLQAKAAGLPQPSVPQARSSAAQVAPKGLASAPLVDDDEEDGTLVRPMPNHAVRAVRAKLGLPTSPQQQAVLRRTGEVPAAPKSVPAPARSVPPPARSAPAVASVPPPARSAPSSSPAAQAPTDEYTRQLAMTGSGPMALASSGALPALAASGGSPALAHASGAYNAYGTGAHPAHAAHASGALPAMASGGYPQAMGSGGYPQMGSGGYPQAYGTGGYPQAPSSAAALASAPHLFVPQAPYSDPRLDPMAAPLTRSHRTRPAMPWAAAFGGVGLAVAVAAAALLNGAPDAFADTTASFVDPARTPAQLREEAREVPAAGQAEAPKVAEAAPAPPPAAPAPVVAQAPAVATPTPAAVVAEAPKVAEPAKPAEAPKVAAAAPAPAPKPVHVAAAPAPARVEPAPKPVAAAPAPAPKPVAKVEKPAKPSKSSGGSDDETRAAMEALQKAQAESSF